MEEKPYRSQWCYDKNRSVFDTFEMLNEKLVNKDKNATKILMLAAFLGPGEVSTRLFADTDSFTSTILNPERHESATPLQEDKVTSDLTRWFKHLTKNQFASRHAIGMLEQWCLCKTRKNRQGRVISFSVHNAIRRWCFQGMEKENIKAWIFFSAFGISAHLKDIGCRGDRFVPYHSFAKHIHHCSSMIHRYDLESTMRRTSYICHQYGFIAARFAQYYYDSRRYMEAEELLKSAIEYEMSLQGSRWPGDRRSLKLIEMLGLVYLESSNLEKAESTFNDLLENSKALLGEMDGLTVDTAIRLRAVQDKLTLTLLATERASIASAKPKRNLPLPPHYSQLHPEHSEQGTQKNRYQDEEYRLRETAEQMKVEFGNLDKDTFQAIINLGTFYEDHENFEAAISQFEQLWYDINTPNTLWRDLAHTSIPWLGLRFQALLSLCRCYKNVGKLTEVLRDQWTPVILAAYNNYQPLFNFLLLDHGAEVTAIDNDGWTILHAAAHNGHDSLVKLLLDHGADVNTAHKLGRTALSIAADRRHESVVKLLLDHGADVNTADIIGWTALSIAADRGHESVVKLLLDHGADVNTAHKLGRTALSIAADRRHESVVKLLLNHGADVNTADIIGRTALSIAADRGYESVVKLLLDHGADVNTANIIRRTALSIAANRGHESVVKLLLDHGAEATAADKNR